MTDDPGADGPAPRLECNEGMTPDEIVAEYGGYIAYLNSGGWVYTLSRREYERIESIEYCRRTTSTDDLERMKASARRIKNKKDRQAVEYFISMIEGPDPFEFPFTQQPDGSASDHDAEKSSARDRMHARLDGRLGDDVEIWHKNSTISAESLHRCRHDRPAASASYSMAGYTADGLADRPQAALGRRGRLDQNGQENHQSPNDPDRTVFIDDLG